MKNMEWKLALITVLQLTVYTHGSFFEVRYPSVVVSAETGGNLSIVAGPDGGNIYLTPGDRGTVYVAHTDMLKLFEVVNSLPPIWGQKAPYSRLGMFLGGDNIFIQLSAQDPEGTLLRYEKVSGALPPGVFLDRNSGLLNGTAPDVDATYEFGIRVIDEHGKYADQTFTVDTRERDQCSSSPCFRGATCIDDLGTFRCVCPSGYGGPTCNIDCVNEAVGVDANSKKVSDAQMAGHYAYASSDHKAEEARLNSVTGWIGDGKSSWVQIDLGSVRTVHAVSTQGFSDTYTLTTYNIDCSVDGNTFTFAETSATNSTAMVLNGSKTYSSVTKQILPVPKDCRYVRFRPLTWSGPHPGFRVEIFACEV